MLRKICFFFDAYPTANDPSCSFVRPVVLGLAKYSIECTVIAPQSVTKQIIRGTKSRPCSWFDYDGEAKANIIQPKVLTFSNCKLFGHNLSRVFTDMVSKKAFAKIFEGVDLLYAHFWHKGILAAEIAEKVHVPVVVATGEDYPWVMEFCNRKSIDRYLHNIKGVISVTNRNLQNSQTLGLLAHNPKTVILPNGIDSRYFCVQDKVVARKKLGLPSDKVIVSFVGSFDARKGIARLMDAVKRYPDIGVIAIGKGPIQINSRQILFQGSIPHDNIGEYLNASDFFVLPTLSEGCCNAIIEAIGCGLPVISANREFNDDILDSTDSIRVNPGNVEEIANAIGTLFKDVDLRNQLASGARFASKKFLIENRVKKIKDFLENIVDEYGQNA